MRAAAKSMMRFTKEYFLTLCLSTGTSVRTCLLIISSVFSDIIYLYFPDTGRSTTSYIYIL